MMKSSTKSGSIRDNFLCMCIVKLVNAFPNLLVFSKGAENWTTLIFLMCDNCVVKIMRKTPANKYNVSCGLTISVPA